MLEIRGLSKRFGETWAVRDARLTIQQGEFFSLLGPSGCGKTTLLRMISGLEQPSEGELWMDGRRIDPLAPDQRSFNMVFQRYALFPHLDVSHNISFGLRMKRVPEAEISQRLKEMLSLVKLEGFETRAVDSLSGGQQQRVALARALINRPRVLLLDEPLSALDLKLRQAMQVELLSIQRRLGLTVVLVTHDQEEALTLSDRVAVMSGGKIEQIGPSREVYENPATEFVARFIGTINVLEGSVTQVEGRELSLRAGEYDIRAKLSPTRNSDAFSPGGAARVLVRPERLRVDGPKLAPEVGRNRVSGVVQETLYQGAATQVLVKVQSTVFQALVPNVGKAFDAEPGTRLELSWAVEDGLVLAGGADARSERGPA